MALGSRFRLFADGRCVEAIQAPRYHNAFAENQIFNTEFFPLRVGLSYK